MSTFKFPPPKLGSGLVLVRQTTEMAESWQGCGPDIIGLVVPIPLEPDRRAGWHSRLYFPSKGKSRLQSDELTFPPSAQREGGRHGRLL